MTLDNAQLTHKVNNLTETLGYIQDGLRRLSDEQRAQGRRLGRVEKRLDSHDQHFAGINQRLDNQGGMLQEILRRLPES